LGSCAEGYTKIYREKATGARPDRRELMKLLKALAPGDMVSGDADRPLGPLDLRPVRHRQADRGRRRTVPVLAEPRALRRSCRGSGQPYWLGQVVLRPTAKYRHYFMDEPASRCPKN
jgi:hypothetical protein